MDGGITGPGLAIDRRTYQHIIGIVVRQNGNPQPIIGHCYAGRASIFSRLVDGGIAGPGLAIDRRTYKHINGIVIRQ